MADRGGTIEQVGVVKKNSETSEAFVLLLHFYSPKNVILDFHIHLTCLKCSKPGHDFRAILGILNQNSFGGFMN